MKRFLTITLLFWSMIGYSQNFNKAKMDSLFASIEKNNKGMGNLSIFKEGKEIYNHSIGFSDYSQKQKINEQTKFRIGSISKTFTATIIMQMVEEGKLKLDQKINSFFKEIENADKITIEQLLRHRSGIHNFTDDKEYLSWMIKPRTRDEMIEVIKKGGSDFIPDTKSQYSNSNFVLLSIIAEKTDKKNYTEILETRIIKPLKLANTSYGGKINTAKNEALSYEYGTDWQLSAETDMSIPIGAGALVSTPYDLNVFLNALFNGKLVKESSIEKMKTLAEGTGIGLFKFPFFDKSAYGHTGGIDGFQSVAGYFINEKITVSYCTNGIVTPRNDILIGILSIYFEKPYQIPDYKKLALKSEQLDIYTGVYSSPTFPMKITISKQDASLFAQATGQSAFPLEAFEIHKFKFEQAGIVLEFTPDENKMLLKQGGGNYELKKE